MSKRSSTQTPHVKTKRNPVARSKKKSVQLRGDALEARIREAVREHAHDMGDQIDPNRVSMKAIAARVPCSRTTLQKYEPVVTEALRDLGYRAARRTGDARAEALAHRSELYKQEIDVLKAEIAALRAHHADLYGRLLMASAPMDALVRDEAVAASQRDGCCVLCGGSPPSANPTNIIDLPETTSHSKTRKKK